MPHARYLCNLRAGPGIYSTDIQIRKHDEDHPDSIEIKNMCLPGTSDARFDHP